GLERLRAAVEGVRVASQITAYIAGVVRATREAASFTLGASPRAGVALLKAARAAALLDGRDYVIPDDVKRLACAVLRHRVSVALGWLDAVLAARPGSAGLRVSRDAPPAFSVGREADVSYRWVNDTRRIARLRVRELRPDVLGGSQPSRRIAVPPLGSARDTVSVRPARRGGERGGGVAVDSIGPPGLGALRHRT